MDGWFSKVGSNMKGLFSRTKSPPDQMTEAPKVDVSDKVNEELRAIMTSMTINDVITAMHHFSNRYYYYSLHCCCLISS